MKSSSRGNPRRAAPARAVPPRKGANHRKQAQARKSTRQRVLQRKVAVATPWLARWTAFVFLAAAICCGGFYGWRRWVAWEGGPIQSLRVEGNSAYETGALLQRAGLEIGMPWLKASLASAEDSLSHLPGIQSVKVNRTWPFGVKIVIREADPVAMFRGQGWQALAEDGSVYPRGGPGEGALPVATGMKNLPEEARKSLAAALTRIRREHPDLFTGFSQVSMRGAALEVTWREGGFKLLLDPEDKSLVSMEFLRALLRGEGAAWSGGTVVDLRTEGWAYVR